ncbi:ABC exporter for hemopore HasA, membrane fusion protein (MFP) family component HasE [plant metagenome]|uniref:Membrane fusion protein (MFP) family protein n=2 Tax=root TaxID=1 RepID=A0A1C3K730_9BURK|nr:HlyD family type I secretion periplasmic adaptor subunit [Orrella dioscoreae]SBT27329.1 ABC exporter for hemopore HasA, membrane fusion protein (MFP) family component HasE [Orrella dioscoreae]SOE50104.1 ABC exporter for hemopore HasA, membrane fusion protein (MFP) family component HasE [Orrella dioscoreae]
MSQAVIARRPSRGQTASADIEDAVLWPTAEDARLRDARPGRLGWWVVLLGFGGFLAWAALAPLDNGVPMPGVVVVSGERQAVDSLGGGVVGELLVREGETVSAGQPLLRLDATRAQGETQGLREQLAALTARVARLTAERDGSADIARPAIGAEDTRALAAFELERQLFASRRASLAGELSGIEASAQGSRNLLSGLEASLAHKRAQQTLLREQVDNLKGLAEEGYVPRNRLLELSRMQSQLSGEIASDLGTIGQTRQQLAELNLRAQQRRDAFQQEVRADLAEARVQAEQAAQRLETARFELAHTEIRAPASGIVVGLAAHTVGGVVQAGTRLMEIVPQDQPLTVEGRLPVASVDKVYAGLPVELMFSAFDSARTPRLAGEVALVSADRFEDERSGHPYYTLRVQVGAGELARLGDAPLRAGMPVEVFVRTGERSLLNYLFKPLQDRVRTAWGES